MNLKNRLGDLVHHAYIFYGNMEKIQKDVFGFLEDDFNVSISGNPDFCHIQKDTIYIDDVRGIISDSFRKSLTGKKIHVIECLNITPEAQNSLLKIIEEPKEETYFFIISSRRGFVLPTLLSRSIEINIEDIPDKTNADYDKFISGDLQYRMTFAEKVGKDKDRKRAEQLLKSLLAYTSDRKNPETVYIRKIIFSSLVYIGLLSSSVKMILEHVGLLFSNLKK